MSIMFDMTLTLSSFDPLSDLLDRFDRLLHLNIQFDPLSSAKFYPKFDPYGIFDLDMTSNNLIFQTSIFNKPDDVFDDDESDVDHPQPAYRQYETTVNTQTIRSFDGQKLDLNRPSTS